MRQPAADHLVAEDHAGADERSGANQQAGADLRPSADGRAGGLAGPARMTARGAAVAMLAAFLAGNLLADWLQADLLSGLSFVAGCLLAVGYTQRRALLLVVTTPPVIFLAAVVCAEALTSPGVTWGASAEAVAAGTLLTLAAAAPWLLAGVAAAVVIALCRGLPQCLRDLSSDLSGQADPPDRQPS